MVADPLELDGIIVTGIFTERSKLESAVAITTLSQADMQMRAARGTADLLKAIPGTFTDASAGEVFTRVYSRVRMEVRVGPPCALGYLDSLESTPW